MNRNTIQPRRVRGQQAYRTSPRDRDQTGRNRMYGVPEFLMRLVGWRRLPANLLDPLPRYRHD